MPNGKNGSHPPGNAFTVKCVGKSGPRVVNFSGEGVAVDAAFTNQEDADYFVVDEKYVLDFTHADSGGSGGGN